MSLFNKKINRFYMVQRTGIVIEFSFLAQGFISIKQECCRFNFCLEFLQLDE